MIDSLKGKVVVITGASSGIGWAAAKAFAGRKARLALCARRLDKLKELAGEIEGMGGEAACFQCDVTRPEQVAETVGKVLDRWKGIDVLVNNAGINSYKRFMDEDPETIDRIMRTNYMSAVHTIRAVLPCMEAAGFGHIVNVASHAGIRGVPYMAAYCASKFALVGLTEALRVELRDMNITLTAFCPGIVDTPMSENPLGKNPELSRSIGVLSAEEVAEKIVDAAIQRKPEVLIGEVPGPFFKLMKFFPGTADWLTYRIYRHYKGLFS